MIFSKLIISTDGKRKSLKTEYEAEQELAIEFRFRRLNSYNFRQLIFTKGTYIYYIYRCTGGCSRGVMVKAMVCGIVVRQDVLKSNNNVYFRANTHGKVLNTIFLNSTTTVLLGE